MARYTLFFSSLYIILFSFVENNLLPLFSKAYILSVFFITVELTAPSFFTFIECEFANKSSINVQRSLSNKS